MKKPYLTCIFLLICVLCHAGQLQLRMLGDGVAGMSVTRFAEDPSGKMWIATSNGISLYNGTSFKN